MGFWAKMGCAASAVDNAIQAKAAEEANKDQFGRQKENAGLVARKNAEIREKEKKQMTDARHRDDVRKGKVAADELKGMPREEFVKKLGGGKAAVSGFDRYDTDMTGHLNREKWLKAFHAIDTSGNKVISVQEFETAFGAGTWENFRTDGSDNIDEESWMKVLGWYGAAKDTVAAHEANLKNKGKKGGMNQRAFMEKIGKEMYRQKSGNVHGVKSSGGTEMVTFADIDTDSSGKISGQEWMDAFKMLDTDGDGFISQEEWEAKFGPGTFELWDADSSGEIDLDEWKQIFEAKKPPKK